MDAVDVETALAKAAAVIGRREAAILLAGGLQVERADLARCPQRRLAPGFVSWFEAATRRRGCGVPMAYLTGFAHFWDFRLRVTPHVLVPRPETELLVEVCMENVGPKAHAADLGTGSGAVAIALARSGVARVTATDISTQACALARANARRCGVAQHIQVLQGDLAQPLLQRGMRVDWVLMNPPYIAAGERVGADTAYEPPLALFAPADDPLHFYRRLASCLPAVLRDGGGVVVEVGAGRAAAVADVFSRLPMNDVQVRRDLAGIERAVVARGFRGSAS